MTGPDDIRQRLARQLDEPWDDPARTGARAARSAYFAARHGGIRQTFRLRGQPQEGFLNVGEVMQWLSDRGLIKRVKDADPEGGGYRYEGWGDPYCAVAGWREDPWEDDPC